MDPRHPSSTPPSNLCGTAEVCTSCTRRSRGETAPRSSPRPSSVPSHLLSDRVPVTSTLALSEAVTAIASAATDAHLVVVGRCPESRWSHPYVRSVTGEVAAAVQVPVISVPDGWDGAGSPQVVVGVDDAAESAGVLLEAFAAARARGARLTVVSTWWRPQGSDQRVLTQVEDRAWPETFRSAIEASLVDLRLAYEDVPIEVHVRNARPDEALIEASYDAALCVVGRHDPLAAQRLAARSGGARGPPRGSLPGAARCAPTHPRDPSSAGAGVRRADLTCRTGDIRCRRTSRGDSAALVDAVPVRSGSHPRGARTRSSPRIHPGVGWCPAIAARVRRDPRTQE